MAQLTIPTQRTEKDMAIIGNAWINPGKDGKVFINVKINKGVIMNGVDENCNFLLQTNPRAKRDGKRDADYMVSILTPKAIAA